MAFWKTNIIAVDVWKFSLFYMGIFRRIYDIYACVRSGWYGNYSKTNAKTDSRACFKVEVFGFRTDVLRNAFDTLHFCTGKQYI